MSVTTEPYMQTLVRLRVQEDSHLQSVFIFPAGCILRECHRGSWILHSHDEPALVDPCPDLNIQIVELNCQVVIVRQWGAAEWQWQAHVSAGGLQSVLSNTVDGEPLPRIGQEYSLYLHLD